MAGYASRRARLPHPATRTKKRPGHKGRCGSTHDPTTPGGRGAHTIIQLSLMFWVGGNLLSHTLPSAVPSARAGLASGFGMGPGVSPPPSTTDTPTGHASHQPPRIGDATVKIFNNMNMLANSVLCQQLHSGRKQIVSQTYNTTSVSTCVQKCLINGGLVPVTSTPYDASRSGLSTQSSPGRLRNLISKQASRLDAFSGYPSRT